MFDLAFQNELNILSAIVTLDSQEPKTGKRKHLASVMDFACGSGSLLLNVRKHATAFAGFSISKPWLPVADDFAHENVVNLEADARSILSLYKALIVLRKKLPQLMSGDYMPITAQ